MPLSTSIAVCTYNGERFLQAQLDSLLAQTRLPDEIVIRDDCSSDGTVFLLRTFAALAEKKGITVDLQVNASNVGYRKNFANAIAACHGDLVFLCDQDDIWLAEKLGRFTAMFEARPGLMALHSDAVLIDGDGQPLPGSLFASLRVSCRELEQMHRGQGFRTLAGRNIMTGAAMAFRRALLPDLLPIPASGWVHDAWIAAIAALRGEVDTLETPSIAYRLHEGNQLGIGKVLSGSRRARRMQMLTTEHSHAEQLLAHAQRLHVTEALLEPLRARMRHQYLRATMPEKLLQRLPAIRQELRNGGYRRFSRGMRAVLVDLMGL